MNRVIVGQEKNTSTAVELYSKAIKEIITKKANPKAEKTIFLFLRI